MKKWEKTPHSDLSKYNNNTPHSGTVEQCGLGTYPTELKSKRTFFLHKYFKWYTILKKEEMKMIFNSGRRSMLEISLIESLVRMRVYPIINVYFDFEPKEYDKNIPLKITHIIFFYNDFIKSKSKYENIDKVICKYKLKDNWKQDIEKEVISAIFNLRRVMREKLLREEE